MFLSLSKIRLKHPSAIAAKPTCTSAAALRRNVSNGIRFRTITGGIVEFFGATRSPNLTGDVPR